LELLAGGPAALKVGQPIVLQVSTGLHQVLRAIDDQMRENALLMDQQQKRVGNPRRQVQHD
jgi:hypothetical protein